MFCNRFFLIFPTEFGVASYLLQSSFIKTRNLSKISSSPFKKDPFKSEDKGWGVPLITGNEAAGSDRQAVYTFSLVIQTVCLILQTLPPDVTYLFATRPKFPLLFGSNAFAYSAV